MATISGAQGLYGEVRVQSYTINPISLGKYGNLHSADGRLFEILAIRASKQIVIIRFRGVNDRNAAEALGGLKLFVDRSNLSHDALGNDEFYYTDLEGLQILDEYGVAYGVISGIYDFGAGTLLELKKQNRQPVMIPFSAAAVLKVNLESGHVLIDPIAAGLINDSISICNLPKIERFKSD